MIDLAPFFTVENKNVDLIRYGPKHDGGYVVPNLPYTKGITIGVGGCVRFEVDMLTTHDVKFFLFDHTVEGEPQHVSNAKFYKTGLGTGKNCLLLDSIIKMCPLEDDDITLLKIDCEGGEWDSGIHFTDLSKISALVLELHDLGNVRRHRHYSTILGYISEHFTLVNSHENNNGGWFTHHDKEIPKVIELSYIANRHLENCVGEYVNLNRISNPSKNTNKIPKIIHTCWLSNEPFKPVHQKCIDSWKKHLPDYEIKIWNAENWDINRFRFTKEAFRYKQWAFVSDVVRLDVVYRYGGVWLDLDAEVIKPIDKLLNHEFFTGTERTTPTYNPITPYIFGATKENFLVKELLDYYNDKPFVGANRKFQVTTNTVIIQDILETKYNCPRIDGLCEFMPGYVKYPSNILCHGSEESIIIHHFDSHWLHLPKNVVEFHNRGK